MSNKRYPIAEVIPHGPPMILLDQLAQYDDESATTTLTVRTDSMLCDGEKIDAWVGIEYMAQTIAAYSGCHARDAGKKVEVGFLVGTRKYRCKATHFNLGDQLTINAEKVMMGDNGLGVFECKIIRDNKVIAEANLNVFQPNNPAEFLKEGTI